MPKNKDIAPEAVDALDAGEPRVYELGFHLDPELPSDEVKKAYDAILGAVTSNGSLIAEGAPQKIPLAYTISRQDTSGRRDFDSAHFSWVVYEATPEAHDKVLSVAGGDKSIIRFIDLLTTKETARHATEMRELAIKMSEQAEESEVVADTDLDVALEKVTI